MKSTKKKKSGGGSGGGAQQFLVWHGEKIVAGIVVVVALWFALQGLGYQTLTWQPNALEEDASAAETAIRNSTRSAEEEAVEFPDPDHATFAQQIRDPIPTEPYRAETLWNSDRSASPRTSTQSSESGF